MHALLYALMPVVGIPFFAQYIAPHWPLLSKSTPIVTISSGQIQGRVGYSLRGGKRFWQFLSIPYAEAPVGELRFQPPVPIKERWEGVKQTTRYPPMCLQYESMGLQVLQGVEDCLFLNVFVSSPSEEALAKPNRPVFVFIYGGGYQCGSTRLYYPDFFMAQDDIILITFDYRVGPLGFLNLAEAGDYSEENMRLPRGNMGLKDQLLVLQWIQENIAKFGGDPKRVTLLGQSAGGAMVQMHMLSNKSKDLFQKGISFSGTVFNTWTFARNPKHQKNISSRYAALAGCPLDDKIKLWECLVTADMMKLVKEQRAVEDPSADDDFLTPSIEVVNSDDTIFDKHPREILEAGGGSKIPWILGVDSGDGAVIVSRFDGRPERAKRVDKKWIDQVAFNLGIDTEEVPHSKSEKIREYFFHNVNFSSPDQEDFLKHSAKYISDSFFYRGTHKAAVHHVINGAPTYLLYYNYTAVLTHSQYSYFRAVSRNEWIPPKVKLSLVVVRDWLVERIFGPEKGPRRFGITHSEELLQIFNLIGIIGYVSDPDREFSTALIQTIVNFARNDGKSRLSFRGVDWPSLTKSDVTGKNASCLITPLPTMLMDNSEIPKLIMEPYLEALEFYAKLGKEDNFTSGIREGIKKERVTRKRSLLLPMLNI